MDGKEYPDDLGKSMPFTEFYKRIADEAEPPLPRSTSVSLRSIFQSS